MNQKQKLISQILSIDVYSSIVKIQGPSQSKIQKTNEKVDQNDIFLKHKKDNENDNENDNKIYSKIWENFKPLLIHKLKNISESNEQKNANKGIGHRNKERLGKNDSFSMNNRCVISLKKSIIDDSQFKNNNINNNDNDDKNSNNNNNISNNDNDDNTDINNNNDNNKNNGNNHDKDSYNYHIYYDNIRHDDCDDKNRKKNQRFSGKKNIVNRKINNFRPKSAPALTNRKVNEINGGHNCTKIVDRTSDEISNSSNNEKDENKDEENFYQVK